MMHARSGRRMGSFSVLLVLAAGTAVYANSLTGPFLFDDADAIVRNPHIRRLWPLSAALATPPSTTVTGRPLVQLSFALNYAMGGLDVIGYHAVNLLIHLGAALALYGIVRRSRWSDRARRPDAARASGLATAAALLWVVHPLQTQSVTYLVHRAESLAGLCYLLTLYAVIRGAEPRAWRGWYPAAVLACAAGMACKGVMATAPVAALLYDRVCVARSWKRLWARRWGLYAGLAMTWGLLGMLIHAAYPDALSIMRSEQLSPVAYLRTQAGVILHYLRLSVWPEPLVFYYDWPVAAGWRAAAMPAAVLLGLVGASVTALTRWPGLGVAGLSFFLLLAPTSSLMPIATELAAERRMYLPLAAVVTVIVVMVDVALRRLLRHRARLRRLVAAGLLAAAVLCLGIATVHRNQDYRSEEAIWRDTASKQPWNARAHRNLGAALAAQGRFAQAIPHYRQALRLAPGIATAHYNLGVALARVGRPDEAEGHFREAVRIKPASAEAYNNLGAALAEQGKFDEAAAAFREALRLNPDAERARRNLADAMARQAPHPEPSP